MKMPTFGNATPDVRSEVNLGDSHAFSAIWPAGWPPLPRR